MEKSLFVIYNQRLAGYLMMNGFPLIALVRCQETRRNQFLFYDTPMLKDHMDKWQTEKFKNKKE